MCRGKDPSHTPSYLWSAERNVTLLIPKGCDSAPPSPLEGDNGTRLNGALALQLM